MHEFKEDQLPKKSLLSLQIDLNKFSPATDEEKQQHETMRESTTFFRDGMRKLFKNPLAVASLIVLAVLLVTEAQNRLRSKAIPAAFRGMPITLIYIGVLALAIYGFTGHTVIL